MRRAVLAITICCAAFAAFLAAEAALVAARGRGLLSDVKQLALSDDPTRQFLAVQRKYGHRMKLDGCGREGCYYSVHISNGPMSFLRIISYGDLDVSFSVFKDQLDSVGIQYRSVSRNGQDCVVHVQFDGCSGQCRASFTSTRTEYDQHQRTQLSSSGRRRGRKLGRLLI